MRSLLLFTVLVFFFAGLGKGSGGDVKRSVDSYYTAYSRPDYTKESSRQLASSSSTGSSYYDQADEYGNLAQASGGGGYGHGGGGGHGHGGGHGGGGGYGGGGGWGWGGGGGGGGYGKGNGVNSSAVGLLGFLGLLSLIQNVLRQMSTTAAMTAAPAGRRRRSSETDSTVAVETSKITDIVLPMLSAAAHARDGLVLPTCVYYPMCKTSYKLVEELGREMGTSVGSMITAAVRKFLVGGKKEAMYSKLLEAAKAGRRNGESACRAYEQCLSLNHLPTYALPPEFSS